MSWVRADAGHVPPEIDPARPSVARVCAAILDGRLRHHPVPRPGQPVGLILSAVIHHVLEEEAPGGILDRYKAAVTPGSYLQLTHFCDESPEARANAEVLRRSLGRGQVRSRGEIARYFDGLELVPAGLVYLHEWRPDSLPGESGLVGGTLMLCGVARMP